MQKSKKIEIKLQKITNESSNENKMQGYGYATPECVKNIQKLN
jgi:hypothetical protein